MQYISGTPRKQLVLFDTCLDQLIAEDHPIRVLDAYVYTIAESAMGVKASEENQKLMAKRR
ncbi:MAG: hypothetical protein ACW97O_15530, partial [Candidatus Thorarchaeota archaeon]